MASKGGKVLKRDLIGKHLKVKRLPLIMQDMFVCFCLCFKKAKGSESRLEPVRWILATTLFAVVDAVVPC